MFEGLGNRDWGLGSLFKIYSYNSYLKLLYSDQQATFSPLFNLMLRANLLLYLVLASRHLIAFVDSREPEYLQVKTDMINYFLSFCIVWV